MWAGGGGPACMTKPLSNDLRERLVSAVDSGLSRRSAARRFGVAASTAIKWVNRWRRTGDVGPRPRGGDHRSHRIEAHAEEILALVDETPDITLGEIAAHLDAGHGLTVAQSTVWRLLDRHCQLRLKISNFCRSKISHFERAAVPPDAVFGVSDSVELRVTGLAQRPPRVWRRQPGYPQRAGVTDPVSV